MDFRPQTLSANIPLDPGMRREDDPVADVSQLARFKDQCGSDNTNAHAIIMPYDIETKDLLSSTRSWSNATDMRDARKGQQVLDGGTWFFAAHMTQRNRSSSWR